MAERVIFSRHAEAESNAANVLNGDPTRAVGLTDRGRDQARSLGERIGSEELDLVITSEFPRALETATVALDGRQIPMIVLPGLNDPRGGEWEGMDLDTYLAWAETAHADAAPPGGESLRQVISRLAAALRAIVARPESTVLVVGHGLPISGVLAAATADLDDRTVYAPVPNAEPYVLIRSEVERAAERLERAATRRPARG
ncbi:MAG: histidine phosphatase family protein [Actinomycetota bacterium]